MKAIKNYTQLFEFNSIAQNYLQKNNDNKISASISNVLKRLKPLFEDYNDERDTLQINNCLVDEKTKAMLKHPDGSRMFSREGEINLKKQIKELNQRTIEFHPIIADGIEDLIIGLEKYERDAFSGIVIPEIIVE